jgi:hypothetical protein
MLGYLNDHLFPPLTHRPIGRWNPQTWPPLREVVDPLCHPRLGPLTLLGCDEADETLIIESEGGRTRVTIVKEDPIEIIPVLDSPLRPAPRRTTRIQVGPQGRHTGTLVPRSRARELEGGGGLTRDRIHGVAAATTTTVERFLDHHKSTAATTTTTARRNHHTTTTSKPHRGADLLPVCPSRQP